ncbi:MAG: HNH endonuclease signature motif containing protein [Ilumatobacteraceae bacterium]
MVAEGERIGDPMFVNRSVDRNLLAAEALGRLVAGGHQAARPALADITVIVDEQTIVTGGLHEHSVCETGDGLGIPPASVRRLLCNGQVTPIVVDAEGNAVNAGRAVRHANRAQRRAPRAMYRTCAFHGCDVVFDRCEIHHLHPWESDGPTDLSNLAPLCSRHHHVAREGGWSLRLEADRTLVILQPDGNEFARSRPDLPRADHRKRQPAA